jgi:MYXO-CTERM domain-containing protein
MSRLIKHFIPLCGALTVALLPGLASAQECGAPDQDCPAGFECIMGTSDVACPAIACAEGSDCEQPACGMPEPYSYCSPKQCDPDGAADQCGADMVCFSYESGMCSGSAGAAPACAPDEECTAAEPVEPADPVCTTTVESYCTYKYNLPCEAAADCGAGFDCVPYEITSCAGSEPSMGGGDAAGTGGASGGGSAPADGDAPVDDRAAPMEPAPMDPPDCTTELSEEKYCQVIDVTCETAADCEAGWTCEQMYAYGGCTMTTPDSTDPAPNGTEPAPAMGSEMAKAQQPLVVACDVAMEPVEKKCAPPGYSYGYAYAAEDGSVTTSAESGGVDNAGNMGGPLGGAEDPNAPPSPTAPGIPGTAGPGNGNTSTGTNANATTTNTDSGAGCSVGHSPSHSNAGFAGLLLGLAAFALRRKR